MSDNKKRDIFYGIIAVATLIVALVGATLAYFSLSATSNEGAVNATAAVVSVSYSDGQSVITQGSELVPATLDVVKSAYEDNISSLDAQYAGTEVSSGNLCTDSEGKEVCSIYRFSVSSDIQRDVKAILNTEYNGFSYLAYAVRDVTNSSWLVLDNSGGNSYQFLTLSSCDNEGTSPCYSESTDKVYTSAAINPIFGYTSNSEFATKSISTTTQVYDLVLFIKENNDNQDIDQGRSFQGTIVVSVGEGAASNITGVWNTTP